MITAGEAFNNVVKHKESVDLNVIRVNKVIFKFLGDLIKSESLDGETSIRVRIINKKDGDCVQTSEMDTSPVYISPLLKGLKAIGYVIRLESGMLTIAWDTKPTIRKPQQPM